MPRTFHKKLQVEIRPSSIEANSTRTTLDSDDACRDLGIPKRRPVHALRHTFASFALRSGWPVGQLAKWLGHSDINTTYSIYGHLIAEEPPEIRFE